MKCVDDGSCCVILETRKEVIVGGMFTFLWFFTFLPLGIIVLAYQLAYEHIASSFAATMFVGGVMTLVAFQWARSLRSELEVHKELFLSLPWRK